MKLFLLLFLVVSSIFFEVSVANASSVTINADKNLVLNGTEVFYVGTSNLCSIYWDSLYGLDSCAGSVTKNDNYMGSFQFMDGISTQAQKNWANLSLPSVNTSIYWGAEDGVQGSYFTTHHINDPYFIGYWIYPEEPANASQLAAAQTDYNDSKSYDPNHPVFLPTFEYSIGGSNVSVATDIIVFDAYEYKVDCNSVNGNYTAWCGGGAWKFDLTQFIYAWERDIYQKLGGNLSLIPDPVFLHMTSLGKSSSAWKMQTKKQLRAETYFAIIMGVHGVSWWGNKIWLAAPPDQRGLSLNNTQAAMYNSFASELTSSAIQSVLLLPNLNSSWSASITWDNKVNFSNNPNNVRIYTGVETVNRSQLAYAWKHNTTSNKSYLIVVNKYNSSITTSINISGLSGTMNATTIGSDGTGSSASGRILTVSDGNFTDTFDAYAGHVYEISSNASESGSGEDTDTTSYRDYSFVSPGTYYVTVNASNANGTTQIINWTVTVPSESASTPWTTGINGETFSSHVISSNYTCINTGNGSIQLGLVCDNFNDNDQVGWTKTGNLNGSFTSFQGALSQTGNIASYLYQNVSSYQNMSIFTKVKTNNISSSIDTGDLRGNLSRGGSTPYWLFYQYSLGSATQNRSSIYAYNGSSWILVNASTEPLIVNTWNYTYFKVFGNTVQSYIGSSYADALSRLEGQNISTSIWQNGTTIQFGGQPTSNATISWDEIRAVALDANGNQYTHGNYTLNYDIGAGNYIKNLTISSTLPANTNYSVYYRNSSIGNYALVGGLRTNTTEIVELPTPYYQGIDILLDMNASQTDTLSINTIETETTDSDGISDEYIPSTPINLVNTTGNFWVNYTWLSGADNVTDSFNISITNNSIQSWVNSSTADFINSTIGVHNWSNITIYAYNSSGTGTMNATGLSGSQQLANNIPILVNIGSRTVNESQWLNISINGTDDDSDSLSCSSNETFGGLSGCNFNLSLNYSTAGIYTWRFYLNDSYSGSDYEDVLITINDVDTNTVPLITAVINGSVGDTWGIVNFTVNQSDALTHVKYSIDQSLSSQTTNLSSGLDRSVNVTGLINGSKYYYSVFAYNSSNNSKWSNSTIQNFTTNSNVTAINGAPNITAWYNSINGWNQSAMSINAGNSATFNVTVNQTITNVAWKVEGAEEQNTSSLQFTRAFNTVGNFNVTAQAFNENGSSNIIYTVVTVTTTGGGGTDWDYLTGTVTPTGSTITINPSVTGSPASGGAYSFGYVFVDGQTYWVNVSKSGYVSNNTQITFNQDQEVWDVTLVATAAPSITSLNNSKTNTSVTTISITVGDTVIFSAGANQNITTWTWGGASKLGGDGTTNSTASKTFSSAGSTSVTIYGTNANGTSATTTWTINVAAAPVNPYNYTAAYKYNCNQARSGGVSFEFMKSFNAITLFIIVVLLLFIIKMIQENLLVGILSAVIIIVFIGTLLPNIAGWSTEVACLSDSSSHNISGMADSWIVLPNDNILTDSETISNSSYIGIKGTDYNMDYSGGRFYPLSTGGLNFGS